MSVRVISITAIEHLLGGVSSSVQCCNCPFFMFPTRKAPTTTLRHCEFLRLSSKRCHETHSLTHHASHCTASCDMFARRKPLDSLTKVGFKMNLEPHRTELLQLLCSHADGYHCTSLDDCGSRYALQCWNRRRHEQTRYWGIAARKAACVTSGPQVVDNATHDYLKRYKDKF